MPAKPRRYACGFASLSHLRAGLLEGIEGGTRSGRWIWEFRQHSNTGLYLDARGRVAYHCPFGSIKIALNIIERHVARRYRSATCREFCRDSAVLSGQSAPFFVPALCEQRQLRDGNVPFNEVGSFSGVCGGHSEREHCVEEELKRRPRRGAYHDRAVFQGLDIGVLLL